MQLHALQPHLQYRHPIAPTADKGPSTEMEARTVAQQGMLHAVSLHTSAHSVKAQQTCYSTHNRQQEWGGCSVEVQVLSPLSDINKCRPLQTCTDVCCVYLSVCVLLNYNPISGRSRDLKRGAALRGVHRSTLGET